jgi:lipid-A-disaccharide synthase-like uncharacterized protein
MTTGGGGGGAGVSSIPTLWLVIGFGGQAIFTARFLVQWLASERKRDSVVPVAFWWLSLVGGLTLLVYAILRRDPVIMLGNAMGVFIYVRNLMLVSKKRRHDEREVTRASEAASVGVAVPRPHVQVEGADAAAGDAATGEDAGRRGRHPHAGHGGE